MPFLCTFLNIIGKINDKNYFVFGILSIFLMTVGMREWTKAMDRGLREREGEKEAMCKKRRQRTACVVSPQLRRGESYMENHCTAP